MKLFCFYFFLIFLVNLSTESICLEINEILAFLDEADVEICEITTNTASESLTL